MSDSVVETPGGGVRAYGVGALLYLSWETELGCNGCGLAADLAEVPTSLVPGATMVRGV
jgi:hypothetical protein